MCEWIKTAKVGDKVVCIEESSPFKGKVFTITNIEILDCVFDFELKKHVYNQVGIQIDPEPNPQKDTKIYYRPKPFKPVETKKTDISIFTEMLKSKDKQKELT